MKKILYILLLLLIPVNVSAYTDAKYDGVIQYLILNTYINFDKDCTKDADGYYEYNGYYKYTGSTDTYLINICDFSYDTLLHELGHVVWYHYMNQDMRDLWISGHYISDKPEHFPGDYAMTEPEESFAETFRVFYSGEYQDNRVMQIKLKFIERVNKTVFR